MIIDEKKVLAKIQSIENVEERQKLAKVLYDYKNNLKYQKFENYLPYGHPDMECPNGKRWQIMRDNYGWTEWSNKPWQSEFHAEGKDHMQRMLMSGNRVGKTMPSAYETAVHMTGLYPDWWVGRRFEKPVLWWTGSPTNETSRDIVQKELLGGVDKESLGTGFIPRELLIGKPKSRQAGVSDVVDTFKVRHITGGVSTCVLKTYEQGWRKWQGTAPDGVWMDEEPEDNEVQGKIRTEATTRLATTNGVLMVTFTPLLGQTALVMHFQNAGPGVYLGCSTWNDVGHLTEKMKDELIQSYPDHEVQSRTQGVPMMGEGRIFTVSEADIKCQPFEIPKHYARLCGIDFGIDHPASGVWIAWDRDTDTIYVYDCYKKAKERSVYHAEQIKRRGDWIPIAWPHDGVNKEKGSGQMLVNYYRNHGLKMLARSARYDNDTGGSQKQWPIIEDVLERMQTGRFKVFSNLEPWFEEFRNYHTKDGKIVSIRDDVLKATFYAVMMKRFAITNRTIRQNAPTRPMMSMRL